MKAPQPIPYQGSKRALASVILPFFPSNTFRLIEPFAGSAAISIAAALHNKAKYFWLNDINEALIMLLFKAVNNAPDLSISYAQIWHNQINYNGNYYNHIREQFNLLHQPEHFLYILARCVKGAVRYNQQGEFNQSPDKRRLGRKPDSMEKEISLMAKLLKDKVNFTSQDYRPVLEAATQDDLIYMDPPYQGTCKKGDKRYLSGVLFNEFVKSLELLNDREIKYLISYDGYTGTKIHGEDLPTHLGLKKVLIEVGRSSQSTLLGQQEITYESLYISPALRQQVAFSIADVLYVKPEQLSLV